MSSIKPSLTELDDKITQWHRDRKITINGNSLTQLAKLSEEMGELAGHLVRNKDIKDDLGDMYVVMVAIANLNGLNMRQCIEVAYEDIKDRRGELNELGNFIKEKDLK